MSDISRENLVSDIKFSYCHSGSVTVFIDICEGKMK